MCLGVKGVALGVGYHVGVRKVFFTNRSGCMDDF